jgi:hypothetical protein
MEALMIDEMTTKGMKTSRSLAHTRIVGVEVAQSQRGSYHLIPCTVLMIAINAGGGLPGGATRPSMLWKEKSQEERMESTRRNNVEDWKGGPMHVQWVVVTS